jgi:hypothetical protein
MRKKEKSLIKEVAIQHGFWNIVVICGGYQSTENRTLVENTFLYNGS